MDREILLKVVLPLLAATAVSIAIHMRWPADGFFLNLAAGFVGILATIVYVDWILRQHEQQKWSGTQSRIITRIQYLASRTVTGIRVSLGFGTDMFDHATMELGGPDAMREELRRVALNVLVPATRNRIEALDQDGWRKLNAELEATSLECGKLLDRFGSRMKPLVMELVLDLQQHVDSAQTYWRLLPDIAGVPLEQVPRTNTPPEELQAAWNELTARDLRRALDCASGLLKELQK